MILEVDEVIGKNDDMALEVGEVIVRNKGMNLEVGEVIYTWMTNLSQGAREVMYCTWINT